MDTGAWFAIADKSDQYHHTATKHLRELVDDKTQLITSNLVVHETAMLLARRVSKKAAIQFLGLIFKDSVVEVIQSTSSSEQSAYAYFGKYAEHDFSITDCLSFVIMKQNLIKRAFTFDKHFKTMLFSVEPS